MQPSVISVGTAKPHGQGQPVSFAETAARAAFGNNARQRNQYGPPRAKRMNSVVDSDAFEQSDEEGWELSAEEKRKEKLRKRHEEKKLLEEAQRRRFQEKSKPRFVVGTGSKLEDKESECPGQAAPKHVFVARTAMSTTKETVEGCLEYLAGIKGIATCCTPQERIQSGEAFSLSWRVQLDNADFEKALLPTSWKSGWAVKPYYFRRRRPDNQQHDQSALTKFFNQAGPARNLSQGGHP